MLFVPVALSAHKIQRPRPRRELRELLRRAVRPSGRRHQHGWPCAVCSANSPPAPLNPKRFVGPLPKFVADTFPHCRWHSPFRCLPSPCGRVFGFAARIYSDSTPMEEQGGEGQDVSRGRVNREGADDETADRMLLSPRRMSASHVGAHVGPRSAHGAVSLTEFLKLRERGGQRPPGHRFSHATSRKLPHVLKERQLKGLERCDKIFASVWLDTERVMVGTKDNQLLIWDVRRDRHTCLPSYVSDGLRIGHCGIHSIAISSDGVIASGAQAPQDILLLAADSFRPQALLKGHSDWVFALAWLTPNLLVSGGRDSSVMLWDPRVESTPGLVHPTQVRMYHRDKVRDLKVNQQTAIFGTVSADGTIKFWDGENGDPLSSVTLEHKHDLVCMACDTDLNLFVVGSESHLQFVDPRAQGVQRIVDSLDPGGSVRSLTAQSHLLTVGTGRGTISFFDICAGRFLPIGREPDAGECSGDMWGGTHTVDYLTTGRGYLKQDEVFLLHFEGLDMRHTVYTHCYDPTYTKLFVGGGPLPVGLCGCYAAVW